MTKLDADFYNLTQNAIGNVFGVAYGAYQAGDYDPLPDIPPIWMVRRGLAESPAWMMVQAQEFDPEPITVENLRVRAVWSSPEIIGGLLAILLAEGFLDKVVPRGYVMTESGREVMAMLRERRYAILNALPQPIPAEDLNKLEEMLRFVVADAIQGDDIPGTWCLEHSRNRADDNAPILGKILQYSEDLNAFRDDCHMASFKAHGVAAYIWETLSLMWAGSVTTPHDAYEQLRYRGYGTLDFEQAFDDLTRREWIEPDGDGYKITEEGRKVRQDAEDLTDTYFALPFKGALSDMEIETLEGLLKVFSALGQ